MFGHKKNNSTIPERILYLIYTSLAKIVFSTDDIANITNLDSNKPHGYDNVSIRLQKNMRHLNL